MEERHLLTKLYTISFLLSQGPIYTEAFSFLERHARSRQHPEILTIPLKLQSQQAHGLSPKKEEVTL